MQLHELGEVVVVERVGLAEVMARIELIIPNLASRRAFLEEEYHSLYTCTLKRSSRAVKHSVQVAAFQ